MSIETNKALVRRLYEEPSKGNLEEVFAHFAEDWVDHNPAPGQPPGRAGIRQALSMVYTAFPDAKTTVEVLIAEADKVTACATSRGTHQGPMMGLAPTGKPVTITFIDIHRLAGDQIVETWHLVDNLGLLQQLGLVPPPQ